MHDNEYIAPCGMNCLLCMAFQRSKNHCPGCNFPDHNKSGSCLACIIKNCDKLQLTTTGFCFTFSKFSYRRLKQLDLRYCTKYGMSMIENLHTIEKVGINKFIEMEKRKWSCSSCGSLLSVHRGNCLNCGNQNKMFPFENHIRRGVKTDGMKT